MRKYDVIIKLYNTRGKNYRTIKATFEQGDKLQRNCNSCGCWYGYNNYTYKVHGTQDNINELLFWAGLRKLRN